MLTVFYSKNGKTMDKNASYSRRIHRGEKLFTKESHPLRRTFSIALKRKKVKEIEQRLVTVQEVSRALEVSRSAVYKWLRKYSVIYEKQIHVIVESKSESKQVLLLKAQVAELERMLGQKQIQLDHQDIMFEQASKALGVDIKKTFGTPLSDKFGKEEKS
jgi:transposase-like protein